MSVADRSVRIRVEDLVAGERWTYAFDKAPVIIGRSSDVELRIDRPYVSGHHGTFTWDGDSIQYADLDSRNGTLVDGRAAGAIPKTVNEHTEIRIGPLQITISKAPFGATVPAADGSPFSRPHAKSDPTDMPTLTGTLPKGEPLDNSTHPSAIPVGRTDDRSMPAAPSASMGAPQPPTQAPPRPPVRRPPDRVRPPDAPPENEPGELAQGARVGRYVIDRLIGAGGMGAVYRAFDTSLANREVALKTMSRQLVNHVEALERFHREALAVSKLRHPHIVQVFDGGVESGTPFIVMELLTGTTLATLLQKQGRPLSVERTVDICLPLCAALFAIHRKGFVHRDLKPQNIFLENGWLGETPKIVDFGITKTADSTLTGMGHIVGTINYLSPEQASSIEAVDGRSDQFALGTIMFKCVTGRHPHEGGSTLELLKCIVEGRIKSLRELRPDLPEAFVRVVERMLSLDPNDRFPNMHEVGSALFAFGSDKGRRQWTDHFTAPPPEPPHVSQPIRRLLDEAVGKPTAAAGGKEAASSESAAGEAGGTRLFLPSESGPSQQGSGVAVRRAERKGATQPPVGARQREDKPPSTNPAAAGAPPAPEQRSAAVRWGLGVIAGGAVLAGLFFLAFRLTRNAARPAAAPTAVKPPATATKAIDRELTAATSPSDIVPPDDVLPKEVAQPAQKPMSRAADQPAAVEPAGPGPTPPKKRRAPRPLFNADGIPVFR